MQSERRFNILIELIYYVTIINTHCTYRPIEYIILVFNRFIMKTYNIIELKRSTRL